MCSSTQSKSRCKRPSKLLCTLCSSQTGGDVTLYIKRTADNRVVKWWRHKNDFLWKMGYVQLFWTSYMRKVHIPKNGSLLNQTAKICFLKFKSLHTKSSYLVFVHIWNQSKIREFSMGLYGTLNGSIFTFSRAGDLKCCTPSSGCCVH